MRRKARRIAELEHALRCVVKGYDMNVSRRKDDELTEYQKNAYAHARRVLAQNQ